MDIQQETALIARIQHGRRDDFADLVVEYKKPIYNLIFRMTGSHQEAEELAQETFVRAFQNLHRFVPGRRFFPWLYTLCLNLVRNHLKKKQPFPVAHQDMAEGVMAHGDNPEQSMVRRQEAEELYTLVRRLPMDMREALVLRFYQDLSFADVALILDISISGAKMRVYRGLEQLRQLMRTED